ncbi:unnamed protein product, partial [Pleuronectes platessa]
MLWSWEEMISLETSCPSHADPVFVLLLLLSGGQRNPPDPVRNSASAHSYTETFFERKDRVMKEERGRGTHRQTETDCPASWWTLYQGNCLSSVLSGDILEVDAHCDAIEDVT